MGYNILSRILVGNGKSIRQSIFHVLKSYLNPEYIFLLKPLKVARWTIPVKQTIKDTVRTKSREKKKIK